MVEGKTLGFLVSFMDLSHSETSWLKIVLADIVTFKQVRPE